VVLQVQFISVDGLERAKVTEVVEDMVMAKSKKMDN
jgi:hypothetical protein